jgi:nicotinamidase-related amidase
MVRYKAIERKLPCIEDTPGVTVMSCAAPLPGETIIIKQSFDGFLSEQLERTLQESKKQFLLVAGLITSVCVLFTAASAAQRGYLVALLDDCCADGSLDIHNSVLNNYPFVFDRTGTDSLFDNHDRWMSQLQKL